jgi:NAD(P)-dependent dehydrogenase (short-subunit alcohol dehydrogenase family)
MKFMPDPKPGRAPIAVVTGASQGLGFETARQLAQRGYDLVAVARRGDPLRKAAARIAAETGRDVVPITADLGSQHEVRALARNLDEHYSSLDVLVNNAGIFPGRRAVTVDGVERCLAINYLAPYLLTRLLLPALGRERPGRVVNVSSVAQARGRIDPDDLGLERNYGRLRAYDQSKLAIVLFTVELARRVDSSWLCVNAVDPGWVRTAQTRQLGPYWIINLLGRPMQSSPQQGAATSVRAATDPQFEGVSGRLLGPDGREIPPNPAADDRALAERLWELSARLVRLAPARLEAA